MQRHVVSVYIIRIILYSPQVVVAKCLHGWSSWSDSCYIPLAESLNWLTALKTCQHRGGSLMVPNSLEEHWFVMTLRDMSFREHTVRHLWIGCEIFDQKLKCPDAADAADIFANWHSQTPDDVSGRKCIRKGGYDVGLLFVEDCNKRLFAICEMPSISVYCVSPGVDGRVTPGCLLGHEIKNLTVKGVSECGQACLAEPKCRSFNFWQGGQPKICQLNNATRQEVSDHGSTELDNCFYFEPYVRNVA